MNLSLCLGLELCTSLWLGLGFGIFTYPHRPESDIPEHHPTKEMKSFTTIAAAACLFAGSSMAAGLNFCLSSNQDLCYDLAVPSSSAQSGSGNFYFQIRAPTSYAWVALGTGSGMAGSNIFVMYQDGSGNVTISPRSGTGYSMPQYNADGAKLELLDGSGVSDGLMVANVRCSNCQSWDGGSLDYAGTGNFITAWKTGSMSSSQLDASISKHNDHSSFQLNLGDASVTTNAAVNPFVSSSSSDGGNNSDNNNNNNTTSSDNDTPGNSNSPISIGGGGGGAAALNRKLVVHGILMGITFVALYPVGAFLQPLLKKWFIHAGWQMIAFIIMWVGFGFGYVLAQDTRMVRIYLAWPP